MPPQPTSTDITSPQPTADVPLSANGTQAGAGATGTQETDTWYKAD